MSEKEHAKQDKQAIIDLLKKPKNDSQGFELFTGESGDFLTAVFKSGNQTSLPYHLITKIDFNPSKGITIEFSEYELFIEGQKLDELADLLRAKRIAKIRESDSSLQSFFEGFVTERVPLIKEIIINKL